ncbi:uncharacterized protein LOC129598640 [Paramacrobiotus metropolitanus]|uniref:uncharacterized protein LOC129598640 n=1 Tax=Paramacrobiotus metropolitanus TaxID=2943436 RepID=UPI002445FD71|nr:uncharacterized protein LOC129598640 [Paramacrobiotus metropolitanus]XP_055352599.1 uncharacterized protein LOC129598640 [Paramacrobiotus metropolitanus]XP_055352600.1 uncharacterized protein LOC129598640 [Paramacrobiotus metropolitanus]XP_055352601.1 uncharacterized protein LOC129598640 [Paramacrobiotus metropolitanus]XP_055352602.1 uncharacterized protein LOC129598640 [Paramacrobiotus metropolitanus]
MDCTPMFPAFRRLLVGNESISYQNTVCVQTEQDDGSAWLGYIQDIAGDEVLVDFDSSTQPARRVPAARVWPIPLPPRDPCSAEYFGYPDQPVFVALRDEYAGPFRFRPATVLRCVGECQMYVVSTNVPGTDAATTLAVVDRCQILRELPIGEAALLARTSGLLYVKHEIANTTMLFGQTTAVSVLIDLFREEYRSHPSLAGIADSCRFSLRFEWSTYSFIVVSSRNDLTTKNWIGDSLWRIMRRYATDGVKRPVIRTSWTAYWLEGCRRSTENKSKAPTDVDRSCPTACLCHLPPILLTEALQDLDLHTHAKARRECALWQTILDHPRTTQRIRVATEHLATTECGDHLNCCRTAMALSRRISGATKSLTIVARAHDWPAEQFNWHVVWCALDLLRVLHIKLPVLAVKSFCLTLRIPEILQDLRPHCARLILHVLDIGRALFSTMESDVHGLLPGWFSLPAEELRLVNVQEYPTEDSCAFEETLIGVPRLICDWQDGWPHTRRSFMWA